VEKWYRRFLMATAGLGGILYAGSCVFFEFRIIYHKYIPAPAAVHPVLLFIMGATFAAALACLVAPTSFLQTKTGEYFLGVIGVKNLPLFRLACLLVCVLLGTVTWVVCWLVLPDLLENYGFLAP
jgi:hypothetical protein